MVKGGVDFEIFQVNDHAFTDLPNVCYEFVFEYKGTKTKEPVALFVSNEALIEYDITKNTYLELFKIQ